MKIVALDTSSASLAISILDGERILWQEDYCDQFRHVEVLVPLIQKGCAKAKIELKNIDVFACGLGPGSFTGLRVGIAAVKAFALANDKKIVTFSSLDLIAENVTEEGDILVILDARREKLYCARYRRKNGVLFKTNDTRLISYAALSASLIRKKNKTVVVGDGIKLYGASLKKVCGKTLVFSPEELWQPLSERLGVVVRPKIASGDYTLPVSVLPLYLRVTPAEEAHAKKKK
jgi:tRNA threonylcarbamoyladenosine biosynthesis protein TsaB